MPNARRAALAAALVTAASLPGARPAHAQVRPIPGAAPRAAAVSPAPEAEPKVRAWSYNRAEKQTVNPPGNAGDVTFASLRLPRGSYVVNASATFFRDDHDTDHGVSRLQCTLGGLDHEQSTTVFISQPREAEITTVVVPFNVAGTGTEVHLACFLPGRGWTVEVGDIVLNAVAVDELRVLP
jgi:hypothetical protein